MGAMQIGGRRTLRFSGHNLELHFRFATACERDLLAERQIPLQRLIVAVSQLLRVGQRQHQVVAGGNPLERSLRRGIGRQLTSAGELNSGGWVKLSSGMAVTNTWLLLLLSPSPAETDHFSEAESSRYTMRTVQAVAASAPITSGSRVRSRLPHVADATYHGGCGRVCST